MDKFRTALLDFMMKKDLTQEALSSIIGVSTQAVGNFLRSDAKIRKATKDKYFNKLEGFKSFYDSYKRDSPEESVERAKASLDEIIERRIDNKVEVKINELYSLLETVNKNVLKLSLSLDEHRDDVKKTVESIKERS